MIIIIDTMLILGTLITTDTLIGSHSLLNGGRSSEWRPCPRALVSTTPPGYKPGTAWLNVIYCSQPACYMLRHSRSLSSSLLYFATEIVSRPRFIVATDLSVKMGDRFLERQTHSSTICPAEEGGGQPTSCTEDKWIWKSGIFSYSIIGSWFLFNIFVYFYLSISI